jgi:Fic family protein
MSPGRQLSTEWQGRSIRVWVPDPIAGLVPELAEVTVRATERAAAAVERSDELAVGLEAAARLLLRAEGLASSFIEGVEASAEEVAVAELDPQTGGAAAWVADNLAVVEDAVADQGPLIEDLLLTWHRRLMSHAQLDPRMVGAWRDRQAWIGGGTPLTAAFVLPPASEIARLMDDLITFANRDDLDPITLAAITHAQFETIHPLADGNGRIGRVLVARILKQRLAIAIPPPVSAQFARDIGGYLSGLTLWRDDQVDLWVTWFAGCVEQASRSAADTLQAVVDLRRAWEERVADLRADAAARRLVTRLVDHPVLDVATAAGLLGVSDEAARGAMGALEQRAILTRVPQPSGASRRLGRPAARWAAGELLALIRR